MACVFMRSSTALRMSRGSALASMSMPFVMSTMRVPTVLASGVGMMRWG
jgi:hypothetical protein